MLNPDKIATTNYFGATKFHDDKMVKFVKKDVANYTPEQKQQLQQVIAVLSAEAQLKSQLAADQRDAAVIQAGRALLQNEMSCTDCHQFQKPDEDATAPVLTGYGSRKWLINYISDPAQPDFYGDNNDRMPSFGKDQILDARQIELIADWLRGSWYEPAN